MSTADDKSTDELLPRLRREADAWRDGSGSMAALLDEAADALATQAQPAPDDTRGATAQETADAYTTGMPERAALLDVLRKCDLLLNVTLRKFTTMTGPTPLTVADVTLMHEVPRLVRNALDRTQPAPAVQAVPSDADLRRAVKAMAAALHGGEWAEHVSIDPDATALEAKITRLLGQLLRRPKAAPAVPSDAEIAAMWEAEPGTGHNALRNFARALLSRYSSRAGAQQDAPMQWPKARGVGRTGDMAPAGETVLRVFLDGDNDACVEILEMKRGKLSRAGIEFCGAGRGGGKSPHTRRALIGLMAAMEKDDAESPRGKWPPAQPEADHDH